MLISMEKIHRQYDMKVTGVLHVGAHVGEEADAYHNLGYQPVVWVEANYDLYGELATNVGRYHHTVISALVSDEDGEEATFHITRDPEGTAMSSSLLELGLHKKHAPWVREVGQRTLHTATIDTLAEHFREINRCNFINLDIQGAELLALKGGEKFLTHCDYIYSEVNTNYVYKDCVLLGELDSWLAQRGFSRRETVMTPAEWGDALYVKDK